MSGEYKWATKRVASFNQEADELTVGYVVTFEGAIPFPMAPKATRAEAREYMERLKARYPEDSVLLLDWHDGSGPRTRGGPWRYLLATGDSEVIHTSTLADAKAVLRHKLRRKTLPAGTTWEIDEEAY